MTFLTDLVVYGGVPFAFVYFVAAVIHSIHVFFAGEQTARAPLPVRLDDVECEAEFIGPIGYERRKR